MMGPETCAVRVIFAQHKIQSWNDMWWCSFKKYANYVKATFSRM